MPSSCGARICRSTGGAASGTIGYELPTAAWRSKGAAPPLLIRAGRAGHLEQVELQAGITGQLAVIAKQAIAAAAGTLGFVQRQVGGLVQGVEQAGMLRVEGDADTDRDARSWWS